MATFLMSSLAMIFLLVCSLVQLSAFQVFLISTLITSKDRAKEGTKEHYCYIGKHNDKCWLF